MRRPTGRRLYSRHTFLRDRLQDGATEWRTIDSTLPDPRHARCTTHHEHLPGRIAVSSGFRIGPRTHCISESLLFGRLFLGSRSTARRSDKRRVGKTGVKQSDYRRRQKTAFDLRISDWSSDVCASDLLLTTYVP